MTIASNKSRHITYLIPAVLLCAVLLVGGSGCIHPCLALAEEICECEGTEAEREACKRQAQRDFEQARGVDTDAARDLCGELLNRCDCAYIDTEQGKRDCGLARIW